MMIAKQHADAVHTGMREGVRDVARGTCARKETYR